MKYLLMFVAIMFSVANSMILRKFKNRTFETTGDSLWFNAVSNSAWIVIMLAWILLQGGRAYISGRAIIFGIVYAIIICLFLYVKMQSLAAGPVSITTLIGCCSFVPATFFSVFYSGDTLGIFEIIGMVLILVSLFLCINPAKSGEKLTVRWFAYCGLLFTSGSMIGIFYKIFGRSNLENEINGMMLTAAVFSVIFFFATGFIVNKVTKQIIPKVDKTAWGYAILAGIAGCFYIRLNVSLASVIPGPIFFPVSNGTNIILSTVLGRILFREKLSWLQKTGIITGIIAIFINGCEQMFF